MKSVKHKVTEGIERPNIEKNRRLREKKTYKYWGTVKADTVKKTEAKEKN